MNSILTNLKRRSRSRTKHEFISPSKAKPLDILPGVSEEDEPRLSITSIQSLTHYLSTSHRASSSSSASTTSGGRRSQDIIDRKRNSRRVVLTGAEGLRFDDFLQISDEPPRPAPLPPTTRSPVPTYIPPRPLSSTSSFSSKSLVCDGTIDELDLKFIGLGVNVDFPSPPSFSHASRCHSPTPSCSSTRTTSTTSSSSSTFSRREWATTPVTSDDESYQVKPQLTRAPTVKSHRASVHYLLSSPDICKYDRELEEEDGDEDFSDAEDASWIAQEIGDIFTLNTPAPVIPMAKNTIDTRVRPDSIPPPPRAQSSGRSRFSKPLPVPPRISIPPVSTRGPSIQLDPTFPAQRRQYTIPARPPPPPPIRIDCPSPSMEEKTEELLHLLASAALDSGFLGTGIDGSNAPLPPSAPCTPSSAYIPETPASSRPPPRTTLPADIDMFDDAVASVEPASTTTAGECIEFEFDMPSPITSAQSHFSCSPVSVFEFELDVAVDNGSHASLPESPLAGMWAPAAPEKVLRSRWSCSTLASIDAHQVPSSTSSWMTRFNLRSPSKKEKPAKTKGRSSLNLLSLKGPSNSGSHLKRSLDLQQRDSHHSSSMSDCGSDSEDSTASPGLQRKPIPIQIFMRT